MMLSNIGEKVVDIASDVSTRRLDASDNLHDSRQCATSSESQTKYACLRYDFQPRVDLDVREACRHRVAYFIVSSILKPQR